MKTEYQYIRMVEMPTVGTGRKTHIFSVKNIKHGDQLGAIQWDGAWRQYIFQPYPNTIYSAGCLKDIQDFIEQLIVEGRR